MHTPRPPILLLMVSLPAVALFSHTSEAWNQQEGSPFGVGPGHSTSSQHTRDSSTAQSEVPLPGEHGVNQVDPATLTCPDLIDFEDVPGGDQGANFDGVLVSGLGSFAERFAGMKVSFVGGHDVLSGIPTSPLTLQVGSPNENVVVFSFFGENVLAGLGPTGFPNDSSIGEGSFAVIFNSAQFQLGFTIVGSNSGSAAVNFFAADGSLIDTILLFNINDPTFAFRRAGNVRDIAGISIHNADGGGLGFDNFIICDDSDERVTICHLPAGDPDLARTITVSVNAVPVHLAHGDYYGSCEDDGG